MTANRNAALKTGYEHHDRQAQQAEGRRHNKATEEIERKKMRHGAIGNYIKAGVDTIGNIAKIVNDPAFYMKIPGTEPAGNVNAVKIGGIPYEMEVYDSSNTALKKSKFIPPQIMIASYHPAVGTTTADVANTGTHSSGRPLVNPLAVTDFQKAAQELFAYLRKKNGGSLNGLDPSDVLEALICFGELAGLREHLARLYRLTNSWEKGERAVPAMLVASIYHIPSGYTATNLMNYWAEHRIELLSQINMLTKRLNTLPIPKSFAYALRRIYLNSRIFVENSGSLYKKYYAYVPQGFLQWLDVPETITTSGGGDFDVMVLGEREIATGITSIAQVTSLINDVAGALFDSTDISLVCSYIMNSFSVEERSDKLLYFEPLKEDEEQYFDFDEAFGLQFRNIKCYGDTASGKVGVSNLATQFAVMERLTTGTIWQNKRYNFNKTVNSKSQLHLLDIIHPKQLGQISQEEAFEASRNIISAKVITDGTDTNTYVDQCGTECFTKVEAYTLKTDGTPNYLAIDAMKGFNLYGTLQNFAYCPCYPSYSSAESDDMIYWIGGNMSLHTWAMLDYGQIDLLHKISVYSEFLIDEVVF